MEYLDVININIQFLNIRIWKRKGITVLGSTSERLSRNMPKTLGRNSWPSEEGWLLGWMDGRDDYRSFVREANDALKKVGRSWKVKDKVGKLRKMAYEPICPQITMYSARYSFGSIAANDLDISERTIGMCLGHSWSKNVTSRYMANDQRKIDMCVSRVVGYLSGADAAEKTLRT